MASHRLKHGAGVLARAAADAVERLVERPAQMARPSVVEDDEVHLLGPVSFFRAAGSRHHREIAAQLLPGGAPGEDGKERQRLLHRRDDFFKPHQRDMNLGERGDHAPVPLVRDEAERSRLGDGEIDATDSHPGAEELLAELHPRDGGQLLRLVADVRVEFFGEQGRDLLPRFVNGGRDQMAGRLARELEDPLAEIRLEGLDARALQRLVEVNFL